MRAALVLLAALGLLSCNQLLGFRTPDREPFQHRGHVLRGISCLNCHSGILGAGDTGSLHIPSNDKCRSCHERPHDDRACDSCHGLPETRDRVADAREHLRFTHKAHMPRVRGNCMRCHVGVAGRGEVLRPSMGVCLSCHNHEERFAVADCGSCHINLEAEGVRPSDHIAHDGNWVREHGVRAAGAREMCETCHSERFCSGCHGVTVPARPEQLAFDDPLGPGVHRAGFRARHPDAARGDPGVCNTCHATEFCSDCHRDTDRAAGVDTASSPHSPGWLSGRGLGPNDHGRAARRDPVACAACHSGAGEALCIGCHRVGGPGGNPHPAGYEGDRRSLAGPACRGCHGDPG